MIEIGKSTPIAAEPLGDWALFSFAVNLSIKVFCVLIAGCRIGQAFVRFIFVYGDYLAIQRYDFRFATQSKFIFIRQHRDKELSFLYKSRHIARAILRYHQFTALI